MHVRQFGRRGFWIGVLLCFALPAARAQGKVLMGLVKDGHSDERIPFATIRFHPGGYGKLTDSAGNFLFHFPAWPADTLEVSYVGYQNYRYLIPDSLRKHSGSDTISLTLELERGHYETEVVVHRKIDFALSLWRKIVRHKSQNDRYRFGNFSYELYNKLELDLNHVNRERLEKIKLLKPFAFVLDNVDTSGGKPILPVFLTETLSDYYYQRSPLKRREVIRASKTLGVDNESVSRMLGGMDQNVNFYDNFIPVLDKRFVSPLSDNGDDYYHYKIIDTQYVNRRRLIHLVFTPQREGQNCFEGDCWVHDSSFAIQKMTLRLDAGSNLNFVQDLSLIQEFDRIHDSVWFLVKDKFVIDIAPLGKSGADFIGRKTTTYRNILINDTAVTHQLDKNAISEEVILEPGARDRPDSFWVNARHEDLNRNEKAVYKMIDTLVSMPLFNRYANYLDFIVTGYMNVGKFRIGPWFNWIYWNQLQGFRLRFDLGTNRFFSRKVILHGYLAYGFGDQTFRGEADALYLFSRAPRLSLYAMYRNDLDYNQQYYDEITSDNIFSLAVRKPGVPIKFLNLEEEKLQLFKEWHTGFSFTLTGDRKIYDPLMNLPPKSLFENTTGQPLNTFELSVNLRFAYLEKFFETTFYRTSLGSVYPIIDIRYTQGIPNVLQSSYAYRKIFVSISNYRKVPPFGNIYYNVFAGKTTGTLPFMLLNIPPGNETYYYNKYAFSLMNQYQYLFDRYFGVNYEHNIGNGLFRFIPFTRKLKLRQFYNAKMIVGSVSQANIDYNQSSGYTFDYINGQPYLELGTGIDNILHLLRLDFIWRVFPRPLPANAQQRFGIFWSFHLTF